MSKSDELRAAYAAMSDPHLVQPELVPVRLAVACVGVLPISGAGISIFTSETMRIPVGASDMVAAAAERAQFSVAQGPCFDAQRTAQLIVAPEPVIAQRWPVFHDRLVRQTPVRGVIAAPLGEGPAGIGAVDLYCNRSDDVLKVDLTDVRSAAGYITEILIQYQLLPTLRNGSLWDAARWLENPGVTGRSYVLMAMGMVSVGLSLSLDDALAILRGRAFATDSSLDLVAHDVIKGELLIKELSPSSDK